MELKIVLIGEYKTGKTTFCKKLITGENTSMYIPTLGVEVYPYRVGDRCFNLWDTAGQERFGGLRDGYYIEADAFLVFFNSKDSMKKLQNWINCALNVRENAKIIVIYNNCGNYFDRSRLYNINNVTFLDINVVQDTNFDQVFNAI